MKIAEREFWNYTLGKVTAILKERNRQYEPPEKSIDEIIPEGAI